MIYAVSDIHGCQEEYLKLLKEIEFKSTDLLYVLGDVVDRGADAMNVLLDMMLRPNVIPIIGNHDYMAIRGLTKIVLAASGQDLSEKEIQELRDWKEDGGKETMLGFQKLSKEEQLDVLEYMGEFTPYEEVEVNGRNFVLVHGGIAHFKEGKDVGDYGLDELIFSRIEIEKMYFKDRILITGHTPTPSIEKGNKGTIIMKNNNVAIDCGCHYGYQLGAYCLDNGKTFYVKSLTAKH